MSGWDNKWDIDEFRRDVFEALEHDLEHPDPIGAFRALLIAVPLGLAMWVALIRWLLT